MIGVGQADERNVFIRPVLPERSRRVGTDRQDYRVPSYELFVIITQTRQLRAAVRSHEPTQEGKNNGVLPAIIR